MIVNINVVIKLFFRSLAAVDDVEIQQDLNEINLQNINISSARATKRKRTKSNGRSSYDFRDYGIDARRRGSKHQRRKQNCEFHVFIFLYII